MIRNVEIKYNRYFNFKKILIIIVSILLFSLISIFLNFVLSKEKYCINLNLKFDLNTKYDWNIISKRYENIVNSYDTEYKKENLIYEALNNKNIPYDSKKLTINPYVYGRQINIEYMAQNESNGIKVVESIGDSIIKINESFMPNKFVKLEKNLSINKEEVTLDKRLNVLIFAIWGLALGIGISMIMEAKCILRKK
ncbi:hypothetical protein [Clostridium thermobutyricum]|uniref:Uncharacterized protein n=1 Tax=Clostridium thermobutyricum DSM 4928 TaxID=1121339 RepID=A0A1V4SZV2_9CLOT|nr:hypothetical protein [Clostridium thermobutyricum]OPX50373.1 hypothetical protein CLTHE_02300 [Clostridium thermobutyricum DSM 4928]